MPLLVLILKKIYIYFINTIYLKRDEISISNHRRKIITEK